MTDPQEFPHRRYPCEVCPLRADNADNPNAKFPAERWAALSSTVRDPVTGEHPGLGESMFGCHKGSPRDNSDLACAGWLARFGGDHVEVRLAVHEKRLPAEMLTPGENWPPLHPTWSDVVRHQSLPSQPSIEREN